jgi:hypothetical protein
VFGTGGFGEQFRALAEGRSAVVPIRKRRIALHVAVYLALLVGTGWLGLLRVIEWIEGGRPDYFMLIGAIGVIGGAIGLHSTLRQLVPPRRLVLTRERLTEEVRRDDHWTAVVDVPWAEVRSVTVPSIRRDLVRLPGAVTCSLAPAGTETKPPLRLASGYGPSKPLAELLDAARNGLIG